MTITSPRTICSRVVRALAAITGFLIAFSPFYGRAMAAPAPATREMVVAESNAAAEAGLAAMKQGGSK